MKILTFIMLLCSVSYSQISVKGTVYDEYLVPFMNAKIRTAQGTTVTSDNNGEFKLKVKFIPTKLTISADGYQNEIVTILDADEDISLVLKEDSGLNEMVISASRTLERIFESPVTVNRLSLNGVKKAPAVSFYNTLENLPNLTMHNQSILNKMINTRGFSNMTNLRFVQLVDGVDNIFSQHMIFYGNLFGPNELDIASVELLPGASSALYGPSAFNGVLLMTTKSPFDHSGISINLKSGVTHEEDNTKPFYNPSARLAYMFDQYFAAKVNFSMYSGDEWHTEDLGDLTNNDNEINRNGKTDYNGGSIHGDGKTINIKSLAYSEFLANRAPNKYNPLLESIKTQPNINVSRTGYREKELTDLGARSKKFDSNIYYRPLGNNKLEINFGTKLYTADTERQISNVRYAMKDGKYQQILLGIKADNFFLRMHTTKTDVGDIYNITSTGILMDLKHETDQEWMKKYQNEFTPLYLNLVNSYDKNKASRMADSKAREVADRGRFKPGTIAFNNEFERLTNLISTKGGTRHYGESWNRQIEGQMNLNKYIKFASIIIGGSYQNISVDTKGTTYTDKDGPVTDDYYGAYLQVTKKTLEDRLKIMGSIRHDISRNYKEAYSPRLAANYLAGEDKNHNFRGSYQTAFRSPTLEDQYLGVRSGAKNFIIGNLNENFKRINEPDLQNPGYKIDYEVLTSSGFTAKSYDRFEKESLGELKDDSGALKLLTAVNKAIKKVETINLKDNPLKPEDIQSYEFGYRGIFKVSNKMIELESDLYFNQYQNFIAKTGIYIPYHGDVNHKDRTIGIINPATVDLSNLAPGEEFVAAVMSMRSKFAHIITVINSKEKIYSYGGSLSLKTKFFNNYGLKINYDFNTYGIGGENIDTSYHPEFNTPKHSIKTSFGNPKLFKQIGFDISHRWKTAFEWHSEYGTRIIPSRSTYNAQVSVKIPSMKSRIKLGGDNILGKSYLTSLGTSEVGSIYYISWTIND